jgi:hypothetical protein
MSRPRSATPGSWKKGQSGNPSGRPVTAYSDKEYFKRLRIAALRKVEVPLPPEPEQEQASGNGKANAEGKKKKDSRTVDEMTLIAEKVIELAKAGSEWAIEHVAQRFDGKVREAVDITTNTNLKVKYESYEEARAALLEEGIDINRIPMLTDMRPPEEREPN